MKEIGCFAELCYERKYSPSEKDYEVYKSIRHFLDEECPEIEETVNQSFEDWLFEDEIAWYAFLSVPYNQDNEPDYDWYSFNLFGMSLGDCREFLNVDYTNFLESTCGIEHKFGGWRNYLHTFRDFYHEKWELVNGDWVPPQSDEFGVYIDC